MNSEERQAEFQRKSILMDEINRLLLARSEPHSQEVARALEEKLTRALTEAKKLERQKRREAAA